VNLSPEDRAELGALAAVHRRALVAVHEAWKGSPEEHVEIMILGGDCGASSQRWSHQADVQVGHEYLLFLADEWSALPTAITPADAAVRSVIAGLPVNDGAVTVLSTALPLDGIGDHF
jgi:hypothetical protein